MDSRDVEAVRDWVTEVGLMGASEQALLTGFCERAVGAGLPLARASVLIDTLHPVYEGRAFRWEQPARKTEGRRVRANNRGGRPPRAGAAARSSTCCRPATRGCGAAPLAATRRTSRSSRSFAASGTPTIWR